MLLSENIKTLQTIKRTNGQMFKSLKQKRFRQNVIFRRRLTHEDDILST